MNPVTHPSHFISPALTAKLRNLTNEAERAGELQPGQLSAIYEEQWFNLFVSKKYNGLALSLPDALKIEEGLAWVDGSLGWVVTLCSGAAWFCGFLQEEMAKTIFSNVQVCFAGSGQPSGIASINETGYEITGNWKYATGAPHATVFTANCILEKDGITLLNKDGKPVIHAFLFLKEEVTIQNDWNSVGLVATASHSFSVKQLQVAQNRCFSIDGDFAVSTDPIYQYPFLQFAEATLAVNSSGMAIHFMDLCSSLFSEKADQPNYPAKRIITMQQLLANAQKSMEQQRQEFYTTITASWDQCMANKTSSKQLLDEVSASSRKLAIHARRLTDELYPYCGLVATTPGSELDLVWRDIHTASQHPLLNFLDD